MRTPWPHHCKCTGQAGHERGRFLGKDNSCDEHLLDLFMYGGGRYCPCAE